MTTHLPLPEARDLPPGRLARRSRHVVSELMRAEVPRRRRRRLVLVLAPAALALVAATGFTTYSLLREPTHLMSIGCYETASESANVAIVDTGAGRGFDGRSPVEMCAEAWRRGAMGGPMPRALAACVLSTGAIGVFPGAREGTCATLGLADVDAATLAEIERFATLRRAILAELGEPATGSSVGSSKCLGERESRAVTRRELDAHGYGEWTIEVAGDGFTAERPCAEAFFDHGQKAVTLIPVWR
jgi:hypothetical protein